VGEGADDVQRAARAASGQIVVVMLGGATYAEVEVVNKFNAARRRTEKRCHAVIGASTLLSSAQFIERIKALVS
jgi:hypothetical protein